MAKAKKAVAKNAGGAKKDAGGNGDGLEKLQDYRHEESTRKNNPEAGLSGWETKGKQPPKIKYEYDPHLDPQLMWSGKAEHTSFEVDTVSLHIHERVSTQAIVRTIKKNGKRQAGGPHHNNPEQLSLLDFFADPQLPLNEAVEFYQHDVDWANRMILGDSLLVMNSLLHREQMAGQVQMIYIDPPYGVSYNSNFQPSTKRRDVKDGQDDSLSREPEVIKAYRDTWKLGLHSYLSYLRDRFLLAKNLLSETGSLFVQINDENMHHVRELMDEVFGQSNYLSSIYYTTTGGFSTTALSRVGDNILWYCKNRDNFKYRQIYLEKGLREGGGWAHSRVEFGDGSRENIGVEKVLQLLSTGKNIRPYSLDGLTSQGVTSTSSMPYEFEGRLYKLPQNSHWKTNAIGMQRLSSSRCET